MENEKQSIVTESRSVAACRWGKEEKGERKGLQRGIRKPLGMMDMFIVFIMVMISWSYSYVTSHQIILFKYHQIILCQLFLNNTVIKK